MRFRMLPGGEVLQGKSFKDIVQAMADLKLEKVSNMARYRQTTAQRVSESFGVEVDTATDETFVKTLQWHGLLERL